MPTVIHPEDVQYRINPDHPGHIVRFLFAGEVFLNTLEAIYLVFFPTKALHLFLADGVPITHSLITLMQFFGVLWVGITIATALGVPNTPTAIETRKSVYAMYAVLDFIAVTWLNYLASKGPDFSGFAPGPLRFLGTVLFGALVQRLIPLFVIPASFGRYEYIINQKRRD